LKKQHRHKRIAHQDHDHSLGIMSHPLDGISRAMVEKMLEALRNVLNRVDGHYRDTTVMYEKFIDESGARLLIAKLRKFEQLTSKSISH
jgi:hypothetical protein